MFFAGSIGSPVPFSLGMNVDFCETLNRLADRRFVIREPGAVAATKS